MIIGGLHIAINTLRIADVDTGSVVAIGNNYFYGWRTYSKGNSGFGRLSGDHNSLAELALRVDDPDWQDMICGEELSDAYLQKLLEEMKLK